MKKLGLVMMPLMAMSLLTNCGNKDPKKIYSQKELMNALKFAGVKYLQSKFWKGTSDYFTIHELSPTTCHVKKQIDLPKGSYYHYEGQTLWEYYYDENKSGFVKRLDKDPDDFIKIEQLYELTELKSCVEVLKLNYKKLKYNNGTYTYNTELYKITYNITLQFHARKLTFFELFEAEGDEQNIDFKYAFTYEEKEIPLPTPVE